MNHLTVFLKDTIRRVIKSGECKKKNDNQDI